MPLRLPRFSSDPDLVKASENHPPLRPGTHSEAVVIVQQALLDLGFPMPISTKGGVIPDGIFGSETRAAVEKFQLVNALVGDGIVGTKTLARLEDEIEALIAAQAAEHRFKRRDDNAVT